MKKTVKPEREPTVPDALTSVRPNLTAREWAEAETIFAIGDMTLIDMAAKFKVTRQTVARHMKRVGCVRGSTAAAHAAKAIAAIEALALTDVSVLAGRIKETKEDHYKMASGLAKLTWSEILKAKQDGVPVATAIGNLRALDSAMSILKKAREERYAVLGLDREDFVDDEGLPELVISELTNEQVAQLRERDDEFEAIADTKIEDDDVIEG